MSGHVRSAVQRSLVPSCAPATEYVAMPDGSSSAAPVMTPGPSDFNSNRIHREGDVGMKEMQRASPPITARIGSPSHLETPYEPRARVVQCDQTFVFATSILLASEEVDRP